MQVQAQIEDLELGDLDSFFEDIEDADFEEPKIRQPVDNFGEEGQASEPQAEPEMYIPEEPVPVFESDSEKYIYYTRKYLAEICLVIIFVLYVANFFVGKNVNSKIAAMWLTEAIPVMKDNFAHLGFGDESNLSLSQVTYDEFEYYGTGRDNMKYLFMNLRTKKRQDVITGGLFGIIWPSNDRIIFDIPIEADLPLEILIVRKNEVKRNLSEMPHLKGLVQPYGSNNFGECGFGFLAEAPEIVDIVFSKKFSALFSKYEKYLEFLHITDRRVYTNNPLVLKAEIFLGDRPNEYKDSVALFKAIIDLVDHIVTNVKLPARIIEKARSRRNEEEKQKKQEVEQEEKERKQEDKEQKIKEKLKTMTPAEKKKYLEKLEKAEKKRDMRGRNKVIKF